MQKKISVLRAALICINSMIGAGLFINPKPLTQFAGAFGFVGYIIAGLVVLPLILSIAKLATKHPVAGGLYVYSKTYLGGWAGFLSGWFYFVGKSASVAVLLHTFVNFFQHRSALLSSMPTLFLDFLMIFFLVGLNSAGVFVGGRVQYLFIALKATPLLFAFGIGTVLFQPGNFYDVFNPVGILSTIPIAIFPMLGFEVICAIANMIEDAEKNVGRVIIGSFFLVMTVTLAFQVCVFGVLGHQLGTASEPFMAMGLKMFSPMIASIVNGFVFASIIGACFSLLTSNCWNLHTIATHGHFPFKNILTRVNRFNVPWVALTGEALVGCFLLSVTLDQVPLQNMAVFSQTIAYILSALAAFVAVRLGAIQGFSLLIPAAACATGIFTIVLSTYRLAVSGVSLPFLILLASGIVLTFGYSRRSYHKNL